MDDQGSLKQQKMKWQVRETNSTNDEKLKHSYDKALKSRTVEVCTSISAEGLKHEGQTTLLQNPGLWQKPNCQPFPSFGLHFYQRAGAACKEQEVNCVHTAELRLLEASCSFSGLPVCIHLHSFPLSSLQDDT